MIRATTTLPPLVNPVSDANMQRTDMPTAAFSHPIRPYSANAPKANRTHRLPLL
jgi:hypothetical protein